MSVPARLERGENFTVYTVPAAGDVVLRMPAATAHRLGQLIMSDLLRRKVCIDEFGVEIAAALCNNSESVGIS